MLRLYSSVISLNCSSDTPEIISLSCSSRVKRLARICMSEQRRNCMPPVMETLSCNMAWKRTRYSSFSARVNCALACSGLKLEENRLSRPMLKRMMCGLQPVRYSRMSSRR